MPGRTIVRVPGPDSGHPRGALSTGFILNETEQTAHGNPVLVGSVALGRWCPPPLPRISSKFSYDIPRGRSGENNEKDWADFSPFFFESYDLLDRSHRGKRHNGENALFMAVLMQASYFIISLIIDPTCAPGNIGFTRCSGVPRSRVYFENNEDEYTLILAILFRVVS